MQYMVVFLADISKKYYLCRYNVTIKLADRWKTNTIGVTDEAINVCLLYTSDAADEL